MSSTAQTVATAQAAKQAPPRSATKNLRGLAPYLRRYQRGLTIGLLILTAMGVVGNVLPLLIGAIVDSLAGHAVPLQQSTSVAGPMVRLLMPFYQPSDRHTLLVLCLMLVGVVTLKGVLSFLTRSIIIGVSRDIEYDLRNDLLSKLIALEPEFYVRNRTGELMSRCTNDLNAVRMVLGPGIMYSATTVVTMALAIVLMVRLSPILTLWVMLPVPVVAWAVRYFGKVIHSLYESIQASLASLSAKAQENLSGVRVIRAYRQEEAEQKSFGELNREYVGRNIKMIRTWSLFFPALTGLIGITFLIILWQGGRLVIDGKISLGALIAFNSYLGLLVWPMIALGWVTNIFQRGAASMGRLNYILHAEPKIDDREASIAEGRDIRGEIEFRNLTFVYPTSRNGNAAKHNGQPAGENEPVLHEINLHVPAGSTLAVVGPTGCGKSTLAALVARLYDAPPESLLIDGRSIREWPLEKLRRAIGFVPQDTFLFSETVRENIALGAASASDEEVQRATRVANIAAEIEDFPKGYDTMVGERGITLSGGQKQRTALARAVIRSPRILVLDDALSNVDTQTEERILRELKDVMRQRTTILISHRCSTVKDADQIVVLRDGWIVERGTHDELLAAGGYYADLYQKQLLEEELEQV
ncbi:MAG TPA: ABC transporter ATP-binding protein [Candidatus Acidoferrales bacterium]|nr:ABC transporter ATP-binding protein [Candidatus Acidoferrales bacterium]